MKPAPFQYKRPTSVSEILQLLASHGEEGKILAGGQSLVPMMNFRLAKPGVLVDINQVAELDYHHSKGGQLVIGALSRHVTLRNSAVVRDACPLVSDAYKFVAHGTVRNRGTLCGSLCHADPAAEMPAVMLALEATMVLRKKSGQREVAAQDFFQGIYATAAQPDELLAEVRIPIMAPRAGYGFKEVSVRRGDFAIVLAAVVLDIRNELIADVRVVHGGVSDRPVRHRAAEKYLLGKAPSEALFEAAGEFAASQMEVGEDVHADQEYRLGLVETLTARALKQAHIRASTERPHGD